MKIKSRVGLIFIAVFLFLLFPITGCITTSSNNEYAIKTTIINEGNFDISVLTEDRFIPAKSQAIISLPRQQNQLQEGYTLRYHINIAGDVIKIIELPEKRVITGNQEIIRIENIYFSVMESYFTITNLSNDTIQVVYGDRYLSALDSDAKNRGNRIQLDPECINVYLNEKYQYYINYRGNRIIIPINNNNGFVNQYIFNGKEVIQFDARPFTEIGKDSPVAIEFEIQDLSNIGYVLSELDQRKIIEKIAIEFKRHNIPLHPIYPEEKSNYEGRIFYTAKLFLSIELQRTFKILNYFSLTCNNIELNKSQMNTITLTRGSENRIIQEILDFLNKIPEFYNELLCNLY